MANFTLAQAQLLGLDDLQSGIVETVVTAAPGIDQIPFMTYSGNQYGFNRELQGIDGKGIGADGAITDSQALTSSRISVAVTGISGQSDIPNLELYAAIGQNAGNDLKSIHIAAAAKALTREYMRRFLLAVTGTGAGTVGNEGWDGLNTLLINDAAFAAQVEDAANAALSFDLLDSTMARMPVRPDFVMGNSKTENKIRSLMRAAGGVTMMELNGKQFVAYDGIPFIRNDYVTLDNVGGTGGNQSNVYFGRWSDGSGKSGITGIVPNGPLFNITEMPALEDKDATRIRLTMYSAMTSYSPLDVAVLKNTTV